MSALQSGWLRTKTMHNDFSPSYTAGFNCPASVTLTRGVERASSPDARLGTLKHSVTEMLITGQAVPSSMTVDGFEMPIDEDVMEEASLCADFAETLRDGAQMEWIEKRFNLDWFYAPLEIPEPFGGTSDFGTYHASSRTLTVVDWKFGRNPVNPDSDQLKSYALMALSTFSDHSAPLIIRLVIVQPALGSNPIRHHTLLISELLEWAKEVLDPALRRIGAGDISENAGDHCKFCRRAGECQALHARAVELARVAFDDNGIVEPELSDYATDDLGAILDKAELIEAWVRKVRAEVSRRLDLGQKCNGWKLVAKRANRKWTDWEAVAHAPALSGIPEEEIFTTPELISPAQMEKVFKKHGLDKKLIEAWVSRESSGTTLVRADDSREEVKSISAASYFDND